MSGHDDRLVRRVVEAAARRPAADACPDAERLGLYAERMLDDGERQGVEAHVVDCARCQAALAALVRGGPEEDVVQGRAAAGVAGGASGDDASTAPWWMGWRWLAPVAATAAAVTVAVWVTRPARPELTMTSVEERPALSTPQAPETAATAAPSTVGAAAAASEPAAKQVAPAEPAAAESPAAPPAVGFADALRRQAPNVAQRAPRADSGVAAQESARTAEAPRAMAEAPPPPPAPAALAPPAAPPPQQQATDAVAARELAESRRGVTAEERATTRAKAVAADQAGGRERRAEAAAPSASNLAVPTVALTGRVVVRTRQALPAGAVIEARLLDVSRPDAPAEGLGRVEIVTRGEQVPVPFTLRYDASRIDASHRYAVQVTIAIDGRARFRTATAHPVLTNGAPTANVEIVVDPIR